MPDASLVDAVPVTSEKQLEPLMTVSRKERLRALENTIRSAMEEFYYIGLKLKEIRDDELYKEDGFDTWDTYCRERWEWNRNYVHKLIVASEYRENLPACTSGTQSWSERAVRELTRIPDKKHAARVAAKVIEEVESTKDTKLTANLVRRFVDADLGIKRPKSRPARKDDGVDLRHYLYDTIGLLEGSREALEKISEEAWERFTEDNPRVVKRLTTACDSLAALLRKRHTPILTEQQNGERLTVHFAG